MPPILASLILLAADATAVAEEAIKEAGEATAVSTELVVELLLIAAVVALATKRLRIPYTVALTVVGIAVGFTHILHPVLLSKEVVLLVFLPPLLFEGTLAMDLATLRSKWLEVLTFAFPVTFLSVAAIAFPVHFLFGFDLTYSLLLGSILAPTDPVSVIALFKEAGVSKKLAHIVEGESCFNDGIGVVLYLIFLHALDGTGEATLAAGGKLFAIEVFGGLGVGVLLGYLTYRALAHIDDHLLEVMISVILAYGVFVVSERIEVSGVMAVVAAGLIMGNFGKVFAMSPTTRVALGHFWEVMAFFANSLVFLLMGIAIESEALLGAAGKIATIYLILTVGRLALVHGFGALLAAIGRTLPATWRHVIAWSGLRGSIPVALAIGLPATFAAGGDAAIPAREETLTIVSGVVLLSMLFQGLSIKLLLAKLGLTAKSDVEEALEVAVARDLGLVGASRELGKLYADGRVPAHLHEELRSKIDVSRGAARDEVAHLLAANADLDRARRDNVVRALLTAARAAIDEAYRRGEISEEAQLAAGREIDARLEAPEGPRLFGDEPPEVPPDEPPADEGTIDAGAVADAPGPVPPEPPPSEIEEPPVDGSDGDDAPDASAPPPPPFPDAGTGTGADAGTGTSAPPQPSRYPRRLGKREERSI